MTPHQFKVSGILILLIGVVLAGYSQFIFDPSVSPTDMMPDYSSVGPEGSASATAAVQDIVDRYERSVAGERTVNIARLAEQQRIFYFGLLLIGIGVALHLFGRSKSEEADTID